MATVMEKVELVAAMEDQEEDEGQDDQDPLIEGGRRRATRVIYDNARLDVRVKARKQCTTRQVGSGGNYTNSRNFVNHSCAAQICMSLLGLVTSSVVIFVLLTMEREQPASRTLAPGIDFMDFKQPKNMISFQEIMEDNFSFNLSSSGDVMVFLHMQKTGGTTFGEQEEQEEKKQKILGWD